MIIHFILGIIFCIIRLKYISISNNILSYFSDTEEKAILYKKGNLPIMLVLRALKKLQIFNLIQVF